MTPSQEAVELTAYIVVLKFWDGSSYSTDDSDAAVFLTRQEAEDYKKEMSHGADSDHLIVETTINISQELQKAEERERKRIEKILDGFIVEDEYYSKGEDEMQIKLLVEVIKIAINNPSRKEPNELGRR